MRVLPAVGPGRFGVVTSTELSGAGWTRDAVRHALDVGRLLRICPGIFAPPPPAGAGRFAVEDLALLRTAIAATLPGDRVGISHLAAALHRDWPVWAPNPHSDVTTWDARVCRAAGVHVHRVDDVGAFVRRGGVPATSAARTIVDIAREFGTEAALVSGDVALRTGALTVSSIEAEIARRSGLRGIAAARAVVPLLDPRSESPLESRDRWHFQVHGIPQPWSQVEIFTLEGRFLGRADHFWEEGVVGEADGMTKYRNDPDALVREKIRQQGFEDVDLEVARWVARDLRDFTDAAQRIQRARVRALRKLDGGPRRWIAIPAPGPTVRE